MITKCPSCHYLMIAEEGCSNCGFSYFPKEANDPKAHTSDSRKVEKPTGEDMPSPAVQLNLHFV